MFLILMASSWAERLRQAGLPPSTFNLVAPGRILAPPSGRGRGPRATLKRLLARPPEQAAAPLAWALTAPTLQEVSGRAYGHQGRALRLPRQGTDAALARRAWDATEVLLDLQPWAPARPG